MKSFRHISGLALLLAALFCACACDGHVSDTDEGTGDIIVNISNSVELETKHSASEGDSAHDGGIMNNLTVWLVQIVGSDYTFVKQSVTAPKAATATVKFTEVARGDYLLLAVANYTGLDATYTEGKEMDANFWPTLIGEISAGESPTFNDTDGMPSSYEKNISVAAGENVIDASLRRCVGRLTFNVRNNLSDKELFIYSMGLSDYNNTQGKLWESEGIGSSMVAFPDFPSMGTGIVQVEHRDATAGAAKDNIKTVYDIYLYETDPGAEFKFDMIAALYPKDTQKSDVSVTTKSLNSYSLSDNSYEYGTSGQYLIRSGESSTYYLGDNGSGTLVATSFTSDDEITQNSDIKNYLWTFSKGSSFSSSQTTVKNVGTDKYISISSSALSLSDNSTNIRSKYSYNWDVSGYQLLFYYEGSRRSYSYLALSSNSPAVSSSEYYWYVREVSEVSGGGGTTYEFVNPDVEIPRNKRIIKYLDTYGASQPLTKIDRNEHVTVNINVFYNRELGQFDFEVEDWDTQDNKETTFD